MQSAHASSQVPDCIVNDGTCTDTVKPSGRRLQMRLAHMLRQFRAARGGVEPNDGVHQVHALRGGLF